MTRSDAWWQGTTFFFECETSGVPRAWAATDERAGVDLVNNLSPASADHVIAPSASGVHRRRVDSLGSNRGYEVPRRHVDFAHRLIDV